MIKNFIYLDEQKLYSFSSQLFDGVTESLLQEKALEKEDIEESQEGSNSGRRIADVIRETSKSTEKKFLHDYSFNLFEKELINSEKLLDVTDVKVDFQDICSSDKPFIRIRAKGKFVDNKEVQSLFEHFNEIGKAMANAKLLGKHRELESLKADNKDSKKSRELQSEIDKEMRRLTTNSNMSLPKEVVTGINTILEQFGDDLVRFKQHIGEVEYTTCMNHTNLRDSVRSICKKYARKTAKEFIVLGTICHSHDTQEADITPISQNSSIQTHLVGMSEHLYNIEQIFGPKGDSEIIIEPIAIYTEL
jgi:ATP-dependent Lon protease